MLITSSLICILIYLCVCVCICLSVAPCESIAALWELGRSDAICSGYSSGIIPEGKRRPPPPPPPPLTGPWLFLIVQIRLMPCNSESSALNRRSGNAGSHPHPHETQQMDSISAFPSKKLNFNIAGNSIPAPPPPFRIPHSAFRNNRPVFIIGFHPDAGSGAMKRRRRRREHMTRWNGLIEWSNPAFRLNSGRIIIARFSRRLLAFCTFFFSIFSPFFPLLLPLHLPFLFITFPSLLALFFFIIWFQTASIEWPHQFFNYSNKCSARTRGHKKKYIFI